MDTEKAIKAIDGKMLEIVLEIQICKLEVQKKRLTEEYNSLMTARAVLEKQLPKKLVYRVDRKLCYNGAGIVVGEEIHEYYKCPCCNYEQETEVFENIRFKYCPNCGQAIYWNDEEIRVMNNEIYILKQLLKNN